MKIETHVVNGIQIAEICSVDNIIQTVEDGADLLGNLYYQGFDRIIIHEQNITPGFFDLRTGIAGDLLQKFSNFRVRLVIVGDFKDHTSKSTQEFIYESNKGSQVNFLNSIQEALSRLSDK